MTDLDHLLLHSAPVRDADLETASVREALADLLGQHVAAIDEPSRLRPRRRLLGVPVAGLAGALVLGGVAAAATVAVTAGGWLNTGSDGFGNQFDRAAAHYPLAPGWSYAKQKSAYADEPGLIEGGGLRSNLALYSVCSWEDAWKQAHARSDRRDEAGALRHIRVVAADRYLAQNDVDNTVVPGLRQLATAAESGDAGPLDQDYAANCQGAK